MSTKFQFHEQDHPYFADGTQKKFTFENGYTLSVFTGDGAYSSDGTYEVAVLKDGTLCYDTPITDDVIGYCSPEEVVSLLKRVSELPPCGLQSLDGNVKMLKDSTVKSLLLE